MSQIAKFAMSLVCAGMLGCGSTNGTGNDVTYTGDAGAIDCAELTYSTFGEAFLSQYCVECHGSKIAQSKLRFDTLESFVTHASKARSEVTSGSMPPRGATAPSSEERAMFSQWVSCGTN